MPSFYYIWGRGKKQKPPGLCNGNAVWMHCTRVQAGRSDKAICPNKEIDVGPFYRDAKQGRDIRWEDFNKHVWSHLNGQSPWSAHYKFSGIPGPAKFLIYLIPPPHPAFASDNFGTELSFQQRPVPLLVGKLGVGRIRSYSNLLILTYAKIQTNQTKRRFRLTCLAMCYLHFNSIWQAATPENQP